jgi:hypothetical protein
MNFVKLALIAGIGAMIPTALSAAEGESGPQAAKPEKQICRRISQVGTRLGSTICMTRSEWNKRDTEGNERARRTISAAEERNDHYINPIQPSGG